MYDQGTGVPRNLGEANRWYHLAAKNGDPDANAVVRAQKAKPQAPARTRKAPRAAQ
nr:SEL1-like repeat protein [uncultured Desulfovibrio sp.]